MLPVLLFGNISLTRCRALLHLIIQARPFQPDLPWQLPVTTPDLIELLQDINRIPHRTRTGKWPKVLRSVPFHLPAEKYSRIRLLHCYLDKRIGLVIRQHGVIFRCIFLDQIILQHQCLQLGIRDNVFKIMNQRDHLLDLRRTIPAGLKILTHPVLQIDRFSHIYNFI